VGPGIARSRGRPSPVSLSAPITREHGFVELPRIGLDAAFGQPITNPKATQENFPK